MSHPLEDARRRADAILANCRKGASAARAVPQALLGVGGGFFADGEGALGMREAQEGLRHYDGWFYVGIKLIAQRIASQPLRVGKRIKGHMVARRDFSPEAATARKAWTKAWQAQQWPWNPSALNPFQKHMLPQCIKGGGDSIELIDTHPLLQALDNPNDIMVRWQLMYLTIACLELAGKAYWWIFKDPAAKGQYQIWPIPPSWIRPKDYTHQAYILEPAAGMGFEQKEIPGNEIIYFSLPDPANPFGSVSPLQAQSNAVYADEAIQTSQARSFKNGLFPALAVIAGDVNDPSGTGIPVVNTEQRNVIMDALRQMMGGPGRAGNFVILDRFIKDIKPISNKPNEMDFLNSGNQIKSRILMTLGVNPFVAGQMENANRASATAAAENFAESAVNPLIELLSQILTARIAKAIGGDKDLVIWIESYRVRDIEQSREEAKIALQYGAMLRDEFRAEFLGLPPLPDGQGQSFVLPPKSMLIHVDGTLLQGGTPEPADQWAKPDSYEDGADHQEPDEPPAAAQSGTPATPPPATPPTDGA